MNTEIAPLLPLDQPRIIRLTIGKIAADFSFRRINDKDWRSCLEAVISRIETKGGERTTIETSEPALADLAQKTMLKVTVNNEEKPLAAVAPRFLVAAGLALKMAHAEVDEASLLSEFTTVKVTALWSRDDEGKMSSYDELLHRFKQPTIEQLRRYKMGVSRVRTSGTATDGVTEYPSRLAIALALYDELIVEVEGYSVRDADLARVKAEEVGRNMDGFHKAITVRALFERDEEPITIGTPEGLPEGTEDDASE